MVHLAELDKYLEHLCEALSRIDRRASLKDYCKGLILPITRKSVGARHCAVSAQGMERSWRTADTATPRDR